MNELAVGTPNPRELKELARRAVDIADAMLGESDRPVPQPEGSSWIGVDPWIRTGPVDSEIATRTTGVPLSRGNRGRKQGIFRSHGDDHKQ